MKNIARELLKTSKPVSQLVGVQLDVWCRDVIMPMMQRRGPHSSMDYLPQLLGKDYSRVRIGPRVFRVWVKERVIITVHPARGWDVEALQDQNGNYPTFPQVLEDVKRLFQL